MFKKLGPLGLLALAAGAYFLFAKKSTPPQLIPTQAGGPTTLEECMKTGDALSCARFGAGVLNQFTGAHGMGAFEKSAIDGMAPASLEGHMASLGAYSGLGGFYGGV